MKFWKEDESAREIVLRSRDSGNDARVVALRKTDDGKVEIYDRCDQCFGVELDREQALNALAEAMVWIETSDK